MEKMKNIINTDSNEAIYDVPFSKLSVSIREKLVVFCMQLTKISTSTMKRKISKNPFLWSEYPSFLFIILFIQLVYNLQI